MAPAQSQPENGSDVTLGVSGLVIALAVISVALRFYTRHFTRQGLRWDDWLILAAVVATLATAASLLWGNAVNPNGLWISENPDPSYVFTDQDVFSLKLGFAISVFYFTIAGATKMGVLCMYYRIFSVSSAFRYQLFLSAALVSVWWVGCTVAALTSCIPLQWNWLTGGPEGLRHCFNYNVFWMAAGASEIVLDVIILTLPISVLVRPRLSLKRKLTISGIFLLGGLVVITGVIKVILGYPPNSRTPSYFNTEVWATVHTGIAIVCSSLPIFNPLLDRVMNSLFVVKASALMSKAGTIMGLRSYSYLGQRESDSGSNRLDRGAEAAVDGQQPYVNPRKKRSMPSASLFVTTRADESIELIQESRTQESSEH
ncbi:hypothetical protein F4777DRAFT_191828 [Nemania sp. FL0916]|nr:hypothetical protein F4777DRAFT_191828 [Nemania sp. FL0916]